MTTLIVVSIVKLWPCVYKDESYDRVKNRVSSGNYFFSAVAYSYALGHNLGYAFSCQSILINFMWQEKCPGKSLGGLGGSASHD